MRYERVHRILDLAFALQAPGRGLCLAEIQERYGVGRHTAHSMCVALRQLFPELHFERGPDRRRYWKLRRGCANPLLVWTVDEIRALEAAIHWARADDRPDRERALRSVAEKVKALIAPPRERGRTYTLRGRVSALPRRW
jgi:predicted DNA-binding transcriptional regulator YafY